MFFPEYIKSQDKKYKYIKKNAKKFNGILENQIKEKHSLELRITTFKNILDLFKQENETSLYNLRGKIPGSLYNGDYGLLEVCHKINCLLALACESKNEKAINCAPQSWMASNRTNKILEHKSPLYIKNIYTIPAVMYNENTIEICV